MNANSVWLSFSSLVNNAPKDMIEEDKDVPLNGKVQTRILKLIVKLKVNITK